MRVRRDATGIVTGVVGIRSIPEQARQFMASRLDRTPVFIGNEQDVDEVAEYMAHQLSKHGESSVRIEIDNGSVYMCRRRVIAS